MKNVLHNATYNVKTFLKFNANYIKFTSIHEQVMFPNNERKH